MFSLAFVALVGGAELAVERAELNSAMLAAVAEKQRLAYACGRPKPPSYFRSSGFTYFTVPPPFCEWR